MSGRKARGGGRRPKANARHAVEAAGRKGVATKRARQIEAPRRTASRKVQRTAVLVLGMHRSGTSLLAGVLQRLGAAWPKTLIPPNASNPKGYGESLAFMRAHDRLLASAGSNWSDWAPFNSDWAASPVAGQFEGELWKAFESEFGDAPLVVMKDPRVCRFARFWIDLLSARDVRALPIITFRNPIEVAASLNRRDHMPTTLGLLLWLRHVIDAERATRGMPRAFVNYEDMLEDWRVTIADVRARLGIRWPRFSRAIELEIDDWIDLSLHREIAPSKAALSRQDVAEWVRRIHSVLLQISQEGESTAAHRIFDAVAFEFDKSSAVFGVLTKNLENVAMEATIEAGRLTEALVSLSQRERSADAKANKLWRDFELERVRASKLEAELSDTAERMRKAEASVTSLKADLLAAAARTNMVANEIAAANEKSKASETRVAELGQKLGEMVRNLKLADERNEDQATHLAAAVAKVNEVEARAARLSTDLAVATEKGQVSGARIEALIGDLAAAAQAVKAAGVDLRLLTSERDMHRKRADDLGARLAVVEPQLRSGQATLHAATEAAKTREADIVAMKDIFEKALASRDGEIARLERLLADAEASLHEAHTHTRKLGEQHAAALEALSLSDGDVLSAAALRAELARAEETLRHELIVSDLLKQQVVDLERALKAARDRISSLEIFAEALRGTEETHDVDERKGNGQGNAKALALAHFARSLMFDDAHYAQQLRKRGLAIVGDKLEHYLEEGAALGLNPHPDFDTVWYLRANPDVARSGQNPLVHYLTSGKSEGRSANPKFDLNASTFSVARPYPFASARALNELSLKYVQARRAGKAKTAFYSAIVGGYDDLSLHEHLNPAADYHLFTDARDMGGFVYSTHPIPYFDTDPVRAARFVKTHPHMLLQDYDIAIWIDGNVLIRGDLSPEIEAFRRSGLAVAAIPHPLRTTVFEEVDECAKRSKDDVDIMQRQVQFYRQAGFDGAGMIESNFMMFRLDHPKLSPFLGLWWAEMEKGSRRDQLSIGYALQESDTPFFALADRPNSVRNHKSLALFHHGSMKRPVEAEAIIARLPAAAEESYAQARERRISAQRHRKVDVIVCVHNALDVVKLCLESVARTRIADRHRIVIVNDGSDSETSFWLEQFAAAHINTKLFRREKAGGYTKAANTGLREMKGDLAILLNSDTIVSPNWIEKMADAVFTSPGAGIVGPMSSAASHQSLPDHRSTATQTAINDLPPGFSVDDMNRWCEENSPADFVPRVPLVHGFCFGVTREVVERVGLFDVDHFPNGYGEENDYCFRAVNAGFSLVIATHVYVYHKKSQSYQGDRRAQLMKAGNQKIRDLHGEVRVIRAVKAMQENPYLSHMRKLSLSLFPPVGAS